MPILTLSSGISTAHLHQAQTEPLRRQIQPAVEACEVERFLKFPLQEGRVGKVDAVVAAQPVQVGHARGPADQILGDLHEGKILLVRIEALDTRGMILLSRVAQPQALRECRVEFGVGEDGCSRWRPRCTRRGCLRSMTPRRRVAPAPRCRYSALSARPEHGGGESVAYDRYAIASAPRVWACRHRGALNFCAPRIRLVS